MELVISVRAGTSADGGPSAPKDVAVQVDREATRNELARSIARCLPGPSGSTLRVVRTGALISGDGPVADLDLRWGDLTEYVAPPSAGLAPPAAAVPFVLRVVGGPSAGLTFPLTPGSYIVGRDPSADIALGDPELSRRHFHLGVGEVEVAVSDLGSTNGTIVDGRPVAGAHTLRPGQVIAVDGGVSAAINLRNDREASLIFISPPPPEKLKAQGSAIFKNNVTPAIDPANYAEQ